MTSKHLILFLITTLFYGAHSLLLHPPFKRFIINKLSLNLKIYRIAYNVFSTLFLLMIFLYSQTIRDQVFIDSTYIKLLALLFFFGGILLLYKSFKRYDLKEFIGLRAESENTLQDTLVVDGLHKLVRHPVYTATIFILLGYFLYSPTYKSAIIMLTSYIYLPLGILLEERKLTDKFGESYLKYKSKVPKLFPNIFRKKARE